MKSLEVICPDSTKNIFENSNNFAEYANVKSDLVYSDSEVQYPLITIMIPTFNSKLVCEAIDSAIKQRDVTEYDVIIVDNHSEDIYFHNIIEHVKELNSKRISVYRNEENIGMYGNWNRCIELAKADYVTYLHSDDLLMDTCLRDLWECHNKVESDAAIIGLETISYTDNIVISKDKIPQNKMFGLIKAYDKCKRGKLRLLTPGGNGCGHFFSKNALKFIGGYSKSGDCGAMLRYQISFPVYDYYKITRIKRVGQNESVNAAKDFPLFGYCLKLQVITKYFNNNRFLRYVSRLEYESSAMPMYGVQAIRKLNIFEKLIKSGYRFILYISSRYHI